MRRPAPITTRDAPGDGAPPRSTADLEPASAAGTASRAGGQGHRRTAEGTGTFDRRPLTDELLTSVRRAERALRRHRRRQAELSARLDDARESARSWQERCADLERSVGVRLGRFAEPAIERLAPPGSARRRGLRRLASLAGTRWHRPAPPDAVVAPTVGTVPMALQPEVTIVVPVHNGWPLTAACLRSIAEDVAGAGYEVVVVDDASTDETPSRLAEVVGVNVVTLEENLGFLGAVNAGIEVARGRYVVLLNNDTLVRPGWLDALVGTAEQGEDIGVVGAKLVYPDGRLQEAGGIVFADASGHNYGRDQDPDDPRYAFPRDVDYCSGACLLVRREVLRAAGGLDTRFSPAYYEDTDLCFAARRLGYRVVYQPEAVVCHLEGASHGTDVTTGVKRHQEVNRHTFAQKWEAELAGQHRSGAGHVRQASWRTPRGRAVVVDHQLPMPDHDSGSRRMSELLGLLTELGYGVTFCPQNGIALPPYRDALRRRGIEVLDDPPQLDRFLQEIGPGLDLAVLSRPTVAWANLPMFRSLVPGATLVYDTVDLHHVRERRRAEVEGGCDTEPGDAAHQARFHHDLELTLARLCDTTWVVSEDERAALLAEDTSLDVAVVPNIHREEPPGPGFAPRHGLLFVGSFTHAPNRDAALWLVDDILPRVHRDLPGLPLYLAGSHPPAEVTALASPDVHVLGWVPDLEDLYRGTRLFVAPLRFGAGMKGKVGESLAHGLPVVTTTVGAEGMGLRAGDDALIVGGDHGVTDAEGLARAVVRAHGDAELWERLAHNGREAVARQFSPDAVRARLEAILAGRRR